MRINITRLVWRFLSNYCKITNSDRDIVKNQIRLYRDIEEVKSVAIDVARYLNMLDILDEQRVINMAKRYYRKLCKAYICWGKDANSLKEDFIISFF